MPDPLSELFFEPELFLVAEDLPDDDFFVVVPEWSEPLFLVADVCELLELVVVAVSPLLVQEARNATPSRQTIDETMDFFIGLKLTRRDCASACLTASNNLPTGEIGKCLLPVSEDPHLALRVLLSLRERIKVRGECTLGSLHCDMPGPVAFIPRAAQ